MWTVNKNVWSRCMLLQELNLAELSYIFPIKVVGCERSNRLCIYSDHFWDVTNVKRCVQALYSKLAASDSIESSGQSRGVGDISKEDAFTGILSWPVSHQRLASLQWVTCFTMAPPLRALGGVTNLSTNNPQKIAWPTASCSFFTVVWHVKENDSRKHTLKPSHSQSYSFLS